jgi:hypothetical protein
VSPDAQRSPSTEADLRERAVAALTRPDLAHAVDLVAWCEGAGPTRTALVANHRGRVRLHADGRHEVLAGADPVADENPMAFLPYELELADPSPPNERNAYPYAYQRLVSIFDDADRSPDLAIVHTPSHWFVDEGGHPGEHGSLDVIQSRAPLVLSGAGVERRGYVDEHAWLVDVGPTMAAAAGVPPDQLVDAAGRALDGVPLTRFVQPGRRKVIGILWDGGHCGDVLHLAEAGELPGIARLVERGTALRGGALAHFPSITLTNHTSILTGVGPGRHGVLGNVFYDRRTGERVVPNDAGTWHRSSEWLRPAVRTVFEMVHDNVPARMDGSPRSASVDEAIDRGADYSTMGVIRASGSTMGSGDLDSLLPDPFASRFVGELEHLKDEYFHWGSQVDDLGLQQVLQLWQSPATAPDLTWWANVVTDAGHHAGGPRSAIARDSLRDSDRRLVAFLDHLEGLGVLDDITIVLTADHGFESADPACTGSWRPALEGLGVPFRDEGPGLVYLDTA